MKRAALADDEAAASVRCREPVDAKRPGRVERGALAGSKMQRSEVDAREQASIASFPNTFFRNAAEQQASKQP